MATTRRHLQDADAVRAESESVFIDQENAVIELVIVYCLAADANSCIEKRLTMEGFQSPVACTTSAQQRAQEYLADHPKYTLKSFRCEMNLPRQAPA